MITKPADFLIFSEPKGGIIQDLQMWADGATHIEVICYPNDSKNVVTIGSNKPNENCKISGLALRSQIIGKNHAIVRICAESPLDDMGKIDWMLKFLKWRTEHYNTEYGDKSLASGGINHALDFLSGGLWVKRPIENYTTALDCSVTAGLIGKGIFPGFEYRRLGQKDLIDPRTLTPGDVLSCANTELIKAFGV